MKKGKVNKKLIIAVVIGIILVIAVVIGIIFFNLGGQKTIPDSVSEQCKFACDSEQTYSFCSVKREINNNLKATCKELSEDSQYLNYGVEKCPAITC